MLGTVIGFMTVGVSVFVAVSFLPAIQPQNAALLRWVRGSNVTVTVDEQRPGDRYDRAARETIHRFAHHHRITDQEEQALLGLVKRPGLLPVTALLHPTLVRLGSQMTLSAPGHRQTQRVFERSYHLNALMACLTVIAVIFPPSVGIALGRSSYWLFPLLNVLAFIKCWALVRAVIADIGVLNLVMPQRNEPGRGADARRLSDD
ncbi:hypothetical protein [Serratia marcescens]|uniref:hypothetical protein n=1 Tax=Serratia marcescens TaxID=615 RepID=UPI0013D95877|nr:hypothetical protein [Serratia marcescens]